MAVIKLGNFDPLPEIEAHLDNFVDAIYTNLKKSEADRQLRDDNANSLRQIVPFEDGSLMTITEIQAALKAAGFMPGDLEKGFFGYRTRSALRLFQEYIRVYENVPLAESLPDGLYGKNADKHLRQWKEAEKKANWLVTDEHKKGLVARWEDARAQQSTAALEGTEYLNWLNFLNDVKAHYQRRPNAMLSLVNEYQGDTDTIKIADWDFGMDHVHLIGIRRDPERGKGRGSDDVILLLIKGMVYKFQGSTDPGTTKNKDGAPFLVQGQHNYQFGWHKINEPVAYMALRPQSHGVLVVRDKNFKLNADTIARGLDPEPNTTINIHWGGRGGEDKVIADRFPWSAGCQVITGTGYLNHFNQPVDCSEYRAALSDEPFTSNKTRGAYNVLADLVTALSGGMANPNDPDDRRDVTVKYMLLNEEDLGLSRFASETILNAIGFRGKMK